MSLAALIALGLQTATIVWWASNLTATVQSISLSLQEIKMNGSPITRDRLVALEVGSAELKEAIRRAIETNSQSLQRVEGRVENLNAKVDHLVEQSDRNGK